MLCRDVFGLQLFLCECVCSSFLVQVILIIIIAFRLVLYFVGQSSSAVDTFLTQFKNSPK